MRCFEPAPQAPFARVTLRDPSGLYATKLRYGGHDWSETIPGICKFANGNAIAVGVWVIGSMIPMEIIGVFERCLC